jgi:hypothetical protein
MGLRERIQESKTEEQVVALFNEGQSYTNASNRTRRSWALTSKRSLIRNSVEAADSADKAAKAAKKSKIADKSKKGKSGKK